MYLSKLELIGFKSFAQKTVIKFNGGMTAIVGPNGCGKTNIVDAIRWALGEQKSAVLRSDLMENVIFNGTTKRKPLGMAEVSLTLLNNNDVLPTEYNEVSVSRRLYRSGESKYLINNTKCRLRDVTDLFIDTGMGADSYSVIELKMIEAILSGKPEERRHLFEEAAGVKKYKMRRKEASRRLNSVQSDLVRVRDIAEEVRKNVNTLARQAAKTRRYNKLYEELKKLEIDLLIHEYDLYKNQSDSINLEIEEINNKKVFREKELADDEASVAELKLALQTLEEKYRDALAEETRIKTEEAQKNKDIAVSAQKTESLKYALERIKREIEEAERNIQKLIADIEKTDNDIVLLIAEKELIEKEFSAIRKDRDGLKSEVDSLRQEANSVNEEVLNHKNRVRTINQTVEKNTKRKESLETKIAYGSTEIEKLRSDIDEIKEASGKSEKLREELKSKHSETEGNLKLGQEQQIELQNTIDELRNKVSDIKNSLGSKRASLEFISGLIDSDENTKFLIKSADWKPGSEKILLAEAVGADDAHRIAVDAALGDAATWFVCDTREDAVAATKILTEKNKGKASFICRENVPETKASAKISAAKGVIGRMSEITRVDDVLRNSLRCLFGDMVLVETMDDAFKVIDAGKAETAVTLSGETVGRSGAMRGGSVAKNEGLTVGKRERIAKLKKEIVRFETDEKTIGETLISARAEYEAIDLRALNNEVRRAESEINTNEQNISRLNYRSESLVQNIKMQEKNAEQFIREIEETDTEIEVLDGEASELHEKLQLIQEQQQSFITDLQNAEAHLRDVEQQTVAAEMKSVRAAGEIKSIQRETESLRYQKENIEIRKTAGEADIEKNETESFNAEVLIKSLTKEIEEIGLLSEKARAEREILDEQIKDLKDQITQYSNDIQDKRRHYESVTESLHKKELGAGELNTKIQSLSERAAEAYEIELLTYEYTLIAEFEINIAKADLDAVKEKLSKIGNVNFMALDEYDTQSERMKFYDEQINDLEISEKNLSETIDEINLTAEGKFRETFDQVHKNFKELFVTLFSNEGYAELSLSDGDPLEADIEITAKPPGKKPHSIEGLSGGEKTLTAIALLFAIYLVKPAPFCILDEVDAPLDDANVGRFITLIRKFSDNTQFLLVTHNKKTMEACDSLYGITQQDEGVSKVVSVRLTSDSNS